MQVSTLAATEENEERFGMCAKQWSGTLLELFTDADMFNVRCKYPSGIIGKLQYHRLCDFSSGIHLHNSSIVHWIRVMFSYKVGSTGGLIFFKVVPDVNR